MSRHTRRGKEKTNGQKRGASISESRLLVYILLGVVISGLLALVIAQGMRNGFSYFGSPTGGAVADMPSIVDDSQLKDSTDSLKKSVEDLRAVVEGLAKYLSLQDSKGKILNAQIINVAGGVDVIPGEGPIKKITFRNLKDSKKNIALGIDDVGTGDGFSKIYAIDPTQLEFDNATVYVDGSGKSLYKCTAWNFTTATCNGRWKKLQDIIPGQTYNFTLTADDPGFAEGNHSVELLDKDSYLYNYTESITSINSTLEQIQLNISDSSKLKQVKLKKDKTSNGTELYISNFTLNDSRLSETISIDATNLSYSDLSIIKESSGRDLLECENFTDSSKTCNSGWNKVHEVTSLNAHHETLLTRSKTTYAETGNNVAIFDKNFKLLQYDQTVINESALASDVEYEFTGVKIKRIKFHSYDKSSNSNDLIVEHLVNDSSPSGKLVGVYSVDPTNISFSYAELSATAQGKYLFKCVEWNASDQTCFGDWKKLAELTPGQDYSINLTSEDPGFLETNNSIVIIDDNENLVTYNETETLGLLESGKKNFELILSNSSTLSKIEVFGFNESAGANQLRLKSDLLSVSLSDSVRAYSLDPTNLSFDNATVTVTATGDRLYKCKSWNFTGQTCTDGNWTLLKDNLVPGETYTFTLTAEDPGYAETGKLSAWLAYYASATPTTPKYRVWNGTLSSGDNATDIGAGADAEWVVVKSSNKMDDKIMATLDDLGIVKAQVWRGTQQAWGNLQTISTGIGLTNDAQRGMDVAIEQNTGRAMVVASNGTATAVYDIWNGTAWSGAQPMIADGCSGTVIWTVLTSKPNSNELLYVDHDSNGDHCAQVWNGTTWINNRTLSTTPAGIELTQQFNANYEASSGDALVVWENEGGVGQMDFATYSGGSWSASAASGFDSGGGTGNAFIRVASMPGSNRLLVGTIDGEEDLNLIEWNGTNFGTAAIPDNAIEIVANFREFDIAYIGSTGNAMAIYADANFDVPSYVTCSGTGCFAGTWSATATTTLATNFCGAAANDIGWMGLDADPFSNKIYLWGKSQVDFGKCFQEYNGTDWGTWNGNLGAGSLLVETEDVYASADKFSDTTGSAVTFVSPTPVNGFAQNITSVTINVTSVDAEIFVSSCKLEFDNVNTTMTKQGTGVAVSCNSTMTSLADGVHTYRVYSTNVAGINGTSELRTLTVDTVAPVVTVLTPSPLNNSFINASSITFNSSAVDALTNVDVCVLNLDGTNSFMTKDAVGLSVVCNSTQSGLAEGLHNFSISANDSASNLRTNGTYFFTVDTINPQLQFVAPTESNNTLLARRNIVVNVTSSDANLVNFTVQLFNLTGLVNSTTFLTSPGFLNYTGLADGNYSFNASAIDLAGNMNFTETRAVYVDATLPTVTINSPQSTTYNTSSNLLINITAVNNLAIDLCWYSLNSGPNVTLPGCNSTSINTTQFSNSLIAYANDTVGNENYSIVEFNTTLDSALLLNVTKNPAEPLELFHFLADYTLSNGTDILGAMCTRQTINKTERKNYAFPPIDGVDQMSSHYDAVVIDSVVNSTFGADYTLEVHLNKTGDINDKNINVWIIENSSAWNSTQAPTLVINGTAYPQINETMQGIEFSLADSVFNSPNQIASFTVIALCQNCNSTDQYYLAEDFDNFGKTYEAPNISDFKTWANFSLKATEYMIELRHGYKTINMSYNSSVGAYECPGCRLALSGYGSTSTVYTWNGTCSKEGYQTQSSASTINITENHIPSPQISSVSPAVAEIGVDNVTVTWTNNGALGVTESYLNLTYENGTFIAQFMGSPVIINTSYLNVTGNYNLTAFARNNLGANSSKATFTVQDSLAPGVSDLIPIAGSNFNISNVIQVSVNVTDNWVVDTVSANITLPNGTIDQIILSNAGSEKYNGSYTIPELVGRYNLTFLANDSVSNLNDSERTFFNANDSMNPSVVGLIPIAGSVFNTSTTIQISANVTDDLLVDTVLANVTYPNGTISLILLNNSVDSKYNASFSIPILVGTYNINFIANDSSGNVNLTESTNFVANGTARVKISTDKAVYRQGTSLTTLENPSFGYKEFINFEGRLFDNSGGENAVISNGICNVTLNNTDVTVPLTFNLSTGNYSGQLDNFRQWGNNTVTINCSVPGIEPASNFTFASIIWQNFFIAIENRSFGGPNNNLSSDYIWLSKLEPNSSEVFAESVNITVNPGQNNTLVRTAFFCGSNTQQNCSLLKNIHVFGESFMRLNASASEDDVCMLHGCSHILTSNLENVFEICTEGLNATTIPTVLSNNITLPPATLTQGYFLSFDLYCDASPNLASQKNVTITGYLNYTGEPANIEILNPQIVDITTFISDRIQNFSGLSIGSNQQKDVGYMEVISFNNSQSIPFFTRYSRIPDTLAEFKPSIINGSVSIYNSTGSLWASDNLSMGAPNSASVDQYDIITYNTEVIPANSVINETLHVSYFNAVRDNETLTLNQSAQKRWEADVRSIFAETFTVDNVTVFTNYSLYLPANDGDFEFSVVKKNDSGEFDITGDIIVNRTSKIITFPATHLSSISYNITATDLVAPAVFDLRPINGSVFNLTDTIEVAANIADGVSVDTALANVTLPNGTIYQLVLNNSEGNKYNASFTIPSVIGAYNITFVANDSTGNINTTEKTFFLTADTSEPSVQIVSPNAGSQFQFNTTIEIAANVTDETAVNAVLANITLPNGTISQLVLASAGGNKYNSSYTASALLGDYNVTIIANDSFNNLNSSEGTNFTIVDQLAPRVFDLIPSFGSTFGNPPSIQISANATDDFEVDTVRANVTLPNGTIQEVLLLNSIGDKYNASFALFSIQGQYNITFIANDTSGNVNSTERTTFNISDVDGPSVFDLIPTADSVFSIGNTFDISANATDASGVSSVQINITYPDGTNEPQTLSNSSANKYNLTFNAPSQLGNYNITFIATDIFGNTNSTERTNFTVMYSDFPQVFDLRPIEGTNFTVANSIEIAANATDPVFGIEKVLANITLPNGTVDVLELFNSDGDKYNSSYAIPDLNGTYNITFIANESSGNTNSTEKTYFIALPSIDLTSPVIRDVNATQISNETATIIWVTDEQSNSSVDYGLNLSLGSSASNSSLAINHSVPLMGLAANTTYFYNVTSCDASGNCNTTGTFNFTTSVFETSAPAFVNTTVDPYAVLIGENVSLDANATDNIAIDTIVADVTLPNGTVVRVSVPGNFTTVLEGIYNVTFRANDTSGNAVTSDDIFLAGINTTVQFNVVDNSTNGLDANVSLFLEGTDKLARSEFIPGGIKIDGLPSGIYDLQFIAMGGNITVRLNSVNISSENNDTISFDRISGFDDSVITYAVNNTYNFSTANVKISYSGESITDESLLSVQKCSNWDFVNRTCNSAFAAISAVQNTTADTFEFNVTSFSAFKIVQGVAPAAPSSGGGGGRAATPAVCKEIWSCTAWSGCFDGVSTRTCFDANSCGTVKDKPQESVDCTQVVPYCFDGKLNQDESDVDCGGNTCTERCTDSNRCYSNSDCISGVCTNNICVPVVGTQVPAPSRGWNIPLIVGIVLLALALIALTSGAIANRRRLQQVMLIGAGNVTQKIKDFDISAYSPVDFTIENIHLLKAAKKKPKIEAVTKTKTKFSLAAFMKNIHSRAWARKKPVLVFGSRTGKFEKELESYLKNEGSVVVNNKRHIPGVLNAEEKKLLAEKEWAQKRSIENMKKVASTIRKAVRSPIIVSSAVMEEIRERKALAVAPVRQVRLMPIDSKIHEKIHLDVALKKDASKDISTNKGVRKVIIKESRLEGPKDKLSDRILSKLDSLWLKSTIAHPARQNSDFEKGLKKYLNTKKGYEFNPLATGGYGLLDKAVDKIEVKREVKATTSDKTMFKSAPQLSERKGLPFEREVGSYLRRHDSAKLSPLVEPTRVVDSFVDKIKRFKVKTRRETAALLSPLKSRSKFDNDLGGYLRKVDPSSTELRLVGKSPESSSVTSYSGSATSFKSRAELTAPKSSVLRVPQSRYNNQFLGIEEAKKKKEEQKLQPLRMMEYAAKLEKAIMRPKASVSPSIKPAKLSVQEKNIIGAKYEDKKKSIKIAEPEMLDIPTQRSDGERQIFEDEIPVKQKGLLKEKSFKKKNKTGAVKQWMVGELKEVYKD